MTRWRPGGRSCQGTAARRSASEVDYFLRSLRFQQAVSLAAFSLVTGIRVVYIDPNPAPEDAPMFYGIPGFFSTLKGALSDIPLAEPINDELSWIARLNDRARRFRDRKSVV